MIVSDNCSTDGTWELCCRFYAENPKVKLNRNASNFGPVQNWLAAARAASGQYVKFLFSDDLLLEGCIRNLVVQLDSKTGFVYSVALIGPSLEASKPAYVDRGLTKGTIRHAPSSRGGSVMRFSQVHAFQLVPAQLCFAHAM